MRKFHTKIASRKRPNKRQKFAGVKRKRVKRDTKSMEQAVSMDLISQLPDPIIHHILSFLFTKEAARTSILSNKWRKIWESNPNLDFDQRNFEDDEQKLGPTGTSLDMIGKSFKEYVYHSLHRHRLQKLSIEKLRLHVMNLRLDEHLSRWIKIATDCNVKELDLQFKQNRHIFCTSALHSARTLTGLRLYGCIVFASSVIYLPLLQKLNLGKTRINQQRFETLLMSCPLIEDLRLVYCSGLQIFQVSNLVKLNRVELHLCNHLKRIDIVVPNLQTFWFYGKKSVPCEINLSSCSTLKALILQDDNMTNEWFDSQISNFPTLEKLVLSKCNKLESIFIPSVRLKRLSLRGCKNLVKVVMENPKLISFEYQGSKLPFSAIDPSFLLEAKLSFEQSQNTSLNNIYPWHAELREFLGKINHSSGLKLVVRFSKNVIIYEELKDVLLPAFYGVKVEIIKSSTCFEDLVDNVLWSCHPERLSLVSASCDKVLKFIHEIMSSRDDNPSCCRYLLSKCWRHYLQDFNVVQFGENFEDATDKRSSQWVTWLKTFMTQPDRGGEQRNAGKSKSLVVGPWGGTGGTSWDDGSYDGVREISLVYDRCIDSIRMLYNKNSRPVSAEKHGGVGGNKTAEIKLQYPDEYLTSVSGHYSPVVHGGGPVIRSLTLKSNLRTFGPFGVEEGTPFIFSMDGGQIVGFKGRSCWYLDAIGFHASRIQSSKLLQRVHKALHRFTTGTSTDKDDEALAKNPKANPWCTMSNQRGRESTKFQFFMT